jgi:LysM repeat protein
MPHRSPARFLAPLALLAAVLTVFLVARSELGSSEESPGTDRAKTTTKATKTSKSSSAKPPKTRTTTNAGTTAAQGGAKTYTVKAGDVLGSIAESTGVPVADLLEYNDLDDASLSVGQKLKLTP